MSELPFIDSHAVAINAPPEVIWDATGAMLAGLGGPAGPPFARLLGCTDTDHPDSAGGLPDSTVGFHVAHAEWPATIVLEGRHRFSRYELRFEIESGGKLRAYTRAAFPGLTGTAYRAAVIGTGAHRVAMRRMLAGIRRRAERSSMQDRARRPDTQPGQAVRSAQIP